MEMSKSYPTTIVNLLTISDAARFLNVSIKTMRRWEQVGLIKPQRNPLNHRLYFLSDLVKLEGRKNQPLPKYTSPLYRHLTISQAAHAIGVSVKTLRRWEQAGKITCIRNSRQQRLFTQEAIIQGKQLKAMPFQTWRRSDHDLYRTWIKPAFYTSLLLVIYSLGLYSPQVDFLLTTPGPLSKTISLASPLSTKALINHSLTMTNKSLITAAIFGIDSQPTASPLVLANLNPVNLLGVISPLGSLNLPKASHEDSIIYHFDNHYINSNTNNTLSSPPLSSYLTPQPLDQPEDTITPSNLNLPLFKPLDLNQITPLPNPLNPTDLPPNRFTPSDALTLPII
ncbi:hypothetical protein A2W24_06605 [Microgenomates group bacterium RBG_16_45_19]|nr:MAG: hypothetical protein A2W24_06605 [Microgenomates group bacterium RBG_16_45_19]